MRQKQWDLVKKVWEKGHEIDGYDPLHYRRDDFGALICFSCHGKKNLGVYSWEIDHIISKRMGGSNSISNLRPLHWRNNRLKGSS